MEQCPQCGCTMRCDQVNEMLVCECYYCGFSEAVDTTSAPCYTEIEMYGMQLRDGLGESHE